MLSSEKKPTIKRMRMEDFSDTDDASKKIRLENGSLAHNRFEILRSERLTDENR